ncbi:MerR family transcriptional regulator [Gemella cuniculi]|uniref:MerR family transcriptional regulator n=1 Tax=Gemella cuniculi TaxID=150240 RepID=UPI000406889D|nr:MerR family transcriptional regulator [Gemella cuniculi]
MYYMKETCQKCDISYDTLKFYCNQQLIPNVKRDKNNYRIFDDHDISWIKSLKALKHCGMSINEIREYLALCLQGKSTIPKRQIILKQKKEELLRRQQELIEAIEYIDKKNCYYSQVIAEKIPYHSNLIAKKN